MRLSTALPTLMLSALLWAPGSRMAGAATPTDPAAARPSRSSPAADTSERLQFSPNPLDSEAPPAPAEAARREQEGSWLSAPLGDGLLTDIEPWHAAEGHHQDFDLLIDYNRVDPLRVGVGWRFHQTAPGMPRVGARLEQAFGRDRTLYGAQIEQPITPRGQLALGVRMTRRTDHNDQQQTGDLENSLFMLLSREDDRDYFEREGAAVYLAWRVPDFSTVTAALSGDQYRSLPLRPEVRSWAHGSRPLRPNPAIDDGESHAFVLRLERPTHLTRRMRAGLYHWIEIERAGRGLGGDFRYSRALADLRSVVRLTPATTLSLRAVAGHNFDGVLPRQKEFTVGGPDGLRAHAVDAYRGDRMALGQAEYDVSLWRLRAHGMESGLHALAFVDAGRAWHGSGSSWDVGRQRLGADGGVGFATSENGLRVYFAKDLHDFNRELVVNVRLQRPF